MRLLTRTAFALLHVQERVYQACKRLNVPTSSPFYVRDYLEYGRLVRVLVRMFDEVNAERRRHRLN